jgi:Rrf2 family protein
MPTRAIILFPTSKPVIRGLIVDIPLRTQYALRALVCLALKRGEGVLSGQRIAALGGIPKKYVDQVMHDLREGGFVRSQRGRGGGYVLSGQASATTVLEVIEALDGPLDDLGRSRGGDPGSALLEPAWVAVRAALREALAGETIATMADRAALTTYHI